PDDGVIVFLHLGAKRTILTVFGRLDVFFSRDLPIGGYHFTEELMKNYGLDYPEAEQVKKTQGMNPNLEKKLSSEGGGLGLAEKSTLEKLGDEINRSLRYYVKETGQSVFTHIVLTGGGASLIGLDTYLSNKFNLPIELYNPFNALDVRVPVDTDNPYQMAAAVGLAIRGDL
ncbi:MAG: pilus assembly protein PilM, partial [bacterium]